MEMHDSIRFGSPRKFQTISLWERKKNGRQTREKKRLGGGTMKGEAGEAEEVMERKNRVADLGEK